MRRIFRMITLFGFVLLPSFSLADEVKNVGLVCLRNVSTIVPIYEILWLENNGKIDWYGRDTLDLDADGDVSEIVFSDAISAITSHRSTEEFILIRMTNDNGEGFRSDWDIAIDRYSLQMITTIKKSSYTSNCEAFKSKEHFMDKIDQLTQQNKGILRKRKI